MKHRDLIRTLRRLARQHGVELVSNGGTSHEKWTAGEIVVIVPRHREINERTARAIIRDLERALSRLVEKDGEDDE